MKLLIKEIANKMPALYETEDQGNDAEIIVKFFTPDSNWTWWAKEASAVDRDGNYYPLKKVWNEVDVLQMRKSPTAFSIEYKDIVDVIFFGLVDGLDKELGYFSLTELLTVRGRFGLPIERDMHFSGKTIKEMM